MVASAQFPVPRPETYPVGTIGNVSRGHLLTLVEAKAAIAAVRAWGASADTSLLSDERSMAATLAKIERMPKLKAAIAGAGLTPRQFVIAQSTLLEAMETALMQEMVGPAEYPTQGRAENVALYKAHAAELGQPFPAGPPPAPGPGSLNAVAAEHRLTMEEIRRVLAVGSDLGPEGFWVVMVGGLYSDSGMLDDEVKALSENAPLRRAIGAHALSPRRYLIARAALRGTMSAILSPETDPDKLSLPKANAANIALFHANAAELYPLLHLKTAEEASADRARADATYRRRVRMMDSLSRLVRTDSLARLFTRAVDGPDDAIPAIAREITCEISRLSWRHGMSPASVAMRRMNDSLWTRHQDRYARMSERLSGYQGPRPASDAACGHTRWPRAADSLMVEPRPTTAP
jgi:hypothetical protein